MVGGNPPNHLKDFWEGIKIRALFSKGQCGPCRWYVGKGDRGCVKGRGSDIKKLCGDM